jgi:hypothetical protein
VSHYSHPPGYFSTGLSKEYHFRIQKENEKRRKFRRMKWTGFCICPHELPLVFFFPLEALVIKDMHPSRYEPYLWLWGENMKYGRVSARYWDGGCKMDGRNTRCNACKFVLL